MSPIGCLFNKVCISSDIVQNEKKKRKKALPLNIKIIFPSPMQGFGQQVIILKNYLTTALMQNPNFSGEIRNVPH